MLPLTKDIILVIETVTGKTPHMHFNDKRKTCTRRYKFSGIRGLSKTQLIAINRQITAKHPDLQFVVQNETDHAGALPPSGYYYSGISVKVF